MQTSLEISPALDRIRWNEKYLRRGLTSFGAAPSSWLVAHTDLLRAQPKGLALDLACGNGRNAIALAQHGFSVEALDISDIAISWLEKIAQTRHLAVHPKLADLEREPLPKARYQVILNFNYLQRSLFENLGSALLSGGLLFFETMTRDQIEILGQPRQREHVLDHHELLHAFPALRVLHYREAMIAGECGENPKAVASLVARKP